MKYYKFLLLFLIIITNNIYTNDISSIKYRLIADYYRITGFYNKAFINYNNAIKINKRILQYHYLQANILYQKGQYRNCLFLISNILLNLKSKYQIIEFIKNTEDTEISYYIKLLFLKIKALRAKGANINLDTEINKLEEKLTQLYSILPAKKYSSVFLKIHFINFYYYKVKYYSNLNNTQKINLLENAISNQYIDSKLLFYLHLLYIKENRLYKATFYLKKSLKSNKHILYSFFKN